MIPLAVLPVYMVAAILLYPAFALGIYFVSRNLSNGRKLKRFIFIPIILGFLFGLGLLMAAISDLPR